MFDADNVDFIKSMLGVLTAEALHDKSPLASRHRLRAFSRRNFPQCARELLAEQQRNVLNNIKLLHKNHFSLGNFNTHSGAQARRRSFTRIATALYCDVSCIILAHFKMLFPLFMLFLLLEHVFSVFTRKKRKLFSLLGAHLKFFFFSRLPRRKKKPDDDDENIEKKIASWENEVDGCCVFREGEKEFSCMGKRRFFPTRENPHPVRDANEPKSDGKALCVCKNGS